MTFKADLLTYLKADAGIAAIVDARIFSGMAPEKTAFPYIVFEKISSQGTSEMLAASELANDVYQFDCWAKSDVVRETMTEAIRDAFDGLRGIIMGAATEVRRAIVQGQFDTVDNPVNGKEVPNYRGVIDVEIIYNRSVPTFP